MHVYVVNHGFECCHKLSLQLVYQYVFATTSVDSQFMICAASVPRQEIQPDTRSLSEYGINSPCLLIVELTEEIIFSEEQWMIENVSLL